MFQKISVAVTGLITFVATAVAHNESNSGYYGPGMMWSDGGGWMHNSAHMAGYNMWGMGWFGLLFGLAFWILVILGIIFLYQKITEKSGQEEN